MGSRNSDCPFLYGWYTHMLRLGEILIQNNEITQQQLDKALHYQREHGGLIGVILVEMGFISVKTLEKYLGIKVKNEQ